MDCRYAPDTFWCKKCASKVKTVKHEGEDGHWCNGKVEISEGGGDKIWRPKSQPVMVDMVGVLQTKDNQRGHKPFTLGRIWR